MSEQKEGFKQRAQRFFKKSWQVSKHPIFLKNMGILLLFSLLFLLLSSKWLSCYTNHGQKLLVPNLIDQNFEAAQKIANELSFELIIADSIFVLNQEPSLVLVQNPLPDATVKEGRKIYITISKVMPDLVTLPNLKGGNDDYNQYSRKLERLGITAKIVDREYSIRLERNTILKIRHNSEDITDQVRDGFKVPMGSIVEFVVSDRRGGTVDIPNLTCKTFVEANFLITSNKLKIGSITLDKSVTDQASAYVKRQVPAYAPSQSVGVGAPIDIVLTQNIPANCGGDDYREQQRQN